MRQIRRSGLATLLVTGGALALSAGAAYADAGAQGAAVGSPGVASGNTIQLPVHVPVNICGNTVNVVGLLNPAAGNTCVNGSAAPAAHGGSGYGTADRSTADRGTGGSGRTHKDLPGTPRTGSSDHGSRGGSSEAGASKAGSSNGGGAGAEAIAVGSPGVVSGNGIQLPIDVPANVSGNSVNVVGIGNPVFGNTSVNQSEEECDEPEIPTTPVTHPPAKPPVTPPGVQPPAPHPGTGPGPEPEAGPSALAHTGAGSVGYAAPASAALLLGGALMIRRSRRTAADQG
ncbi:chaplin [Streptomyces laurentii]|uniref:chaplin n=1 Tax=Streptomyces laurentii TaxID=39478 RepID=UPI00367E0E63